MNEFGKEKAVIFYKRLYRKNEFGNKIRPREMRESY